MESVFWYNLPVAVRTDATFETAVSENETESRPLVIARVSHNGKPHMFPLNNPTLVICSTYIH